MEKGSKQQQQTEKSSFTVFMSPPWSVPQSVKHVSFSEAFPAIGGFGVGRGKFKMALSRSLESIPENAVWQAGRPPPPGGVSAAAAAAAAAASDSCRCPALPPIKRIADGDLPGEMRARAFSDPNAYSSSASAKDRHRQTAAASASSTWFRTEGGSGGGSDGKTSAAAGAARSFVTQSPLKKSPSPKPFRKLTRRSPLDCGSDDGAAAASETSQRLGARLPAAAPSPGMFDRAQSAARGGGGIDPTSPPVAANGASGSRAAGYAGVGGSSLAPASVRARASVTAATSTADFPSPPSPRATPPRFLKGMGGVEDVGGGSGQPRIAHPPNVEGKGNRNHLDRYLRHERFGSEAQPTRTAYALVGSPGRHASSSFMAARPPAAAASVSIGGSHSYSGPMSPIARATGNPCGRVDVGSSSSSSSGGSGSDSDDENPISALQPPPTPPSRSRGREASGSQQAPAANSCSKEFKTILSGFFPSDGSPPSSRLEGSQGRLQGGEAFDLDPLTESRAHFLRAGCRPVSDNF